MEILIYWWQRVDYGEQDDTNCLVPQFSCYIKAPSEICPQRISMERSKTASPAAFFKGLMLTHWGLVMHICVSKLTIIGSDNRLSPGRRQAIIWTNAGILLFRPLGTKFSEILIEICTFSFKKMYLKMSSAKWGPFCLGFNVLNQS